MKALIIALTLLGNPAEEIPVMGASMPVVPVADKNEEEARKQANIKAIKNRDLTITIDYIIPTGMPSESTIDGYTLSIKDGKVKTHLPYRGTATSAIIYGVDEAGIVFDDCPIEIKEDTKKASKGEYTWSFSAKSGNENIDVTITLFDSGSASITCIPTNRSVITYSGTFGEQE